jgi:hypothetical protein
MTMTGWAIALVAVILVAWMLRSVYVVFFLRRPWSVPPNDDTLCRGIDVSCGAISGWTTSLLSIALASVVFLFWRFWRMDRRYRAKARQHARDLVPTAGPIFGKIVGRDDLCRVLMEDLRDGGSRRPHVLVGGVGTGKTAVVVLLTEMLAKRRAIPVPIRLRDADTLDFSALAKDQFMETVNERLASVGEGEKVWRRLLQDGRIVLALKPDCTVGTAASNPPGSSCLNGCPFDLCPYPPKGQQPYRAELSEAFCRHQYMLVRRARIRRSTARWQGLRASQMRTFWSEMANRARIGPAGR